MQPFAAALRCHLARWRRGRYALAMRPAPPSFPSLILRRFLTLVLAVALAATALAHRVPVSAGVLEQRAALSAFLAAGGSLDDLCTDHGPGKHPPAHDGDRCDACRLAGAALVPPVTQASVPVRRASHHTGHRYSAPVTPTRGHRPQAPRAPPATV